MKIYVIDDDPDIIALITVLLESAGHAVSSNTAGTEALPQISKQRPDCVLTDLMMAELDGLDLCREVRSREELAATKVVFVSSRDHVYWQDKARAAGAVGYLTKPLDPATFAKEVERLASES